jgi:hypothetical protein
LASTSGDDTAEAYIKRPWLPDVDEPGHKLAWSGTITAIQPRIRLTRSFDEQSHAYLGYLLRIEGTLDERSEFWVGVGPGAHAKHQFRIGDQVEGLGQRVADQRLEVADLFKVSKLKILRRGEAPAAQAPWNGVPPSLPVYRERGHRRLAGKTYESKCQACIWGCAMPVEIIIGTPAAFGTGRKPSVMDRYHVPATSPVPHAKFLVVMK